MQTCFFIRSNGRYIKLHFQDIQYLEGCRNYVKIVTDNRTFLALFSMKAMENFLPADRFRRIHKSFIVSLDRICSFDTENVYLEKGELPIGHFYRGELEKAVLIAHDNYCKVLEVAMSDNPKIRLGKAV